MEFGKGHGEAALIPVPNDDEDMQQSRKRAGEGPPSPNSHRPRGGGEQDDPGAPLTFGSLQRLLTSQTQLLQASQDSAIQAAVTELKMMTAKEMKVVKKQLDKHEDHIEQLRQLQESTDKRLADLEQRRDSSGSASTSAPADGKINLMLLGGWPDDTPRETLLAELRQALQEQGLHEDFTDLFCTGPRKGFAMGLLWTEPTETAKALKKRMIALAQQVRRAAIKCDSMEQGKVLWANLGRTPEERATASHVGRAKRIILETNPDVKPFVEVDYNSGLVWVRAQLVSATTKPPGLGEEVFPGKLKGSWINLVAVARFTGGTVEALQQRWEELTAY